jgi:hypothetical protein
MNKKILAIIIIFTTLSMHSQPPAQPINNEKQTAITVLTAWALFMLYNIYQDSNSNNKNGEINLIVGANTLKK